MEQRCLNKVTVCEIDTNWLDGTESCSCHDSHNSRSRVSSVTVVSRLRTRQSGATLWYNCLFGEAPDRLWGPHIYLFGRQQAVLRRVWNDICLKMTVRGRLVLGLKWKEKFLKTEAVGSKLPISQSVLHILHTDCSQCNILKQSVPKPHSVSRYYTYCIETVHVVIFWSSRFQTPSHSVSITHNAYRLFTV